MTHNQLHLRANSFAYLRRSFSKESSAARQARKTTACKLTTACQLLPVAFVLLCVFSTTARAAFPLSDTLSPAATAPVNWVGTATGPVNTSPVTSCREGFDCDTYILTFGGTTADWAGKTALIKISWQLPVTDYDLYIIRELSGEQFVVAQSANHPATSHDTHETIDFSPAFYGAGRYLVRVMYTAATFRDQYKGSATVAPAESSCRLPGLTVLTDAAGDSTDAQTNHDIESVSVAEPYLVGTSKLVFTMKVSALDSLPAQTAWRIYFRAQNAFGPRYFVDMRTDANGLVSYKYGMVKDLINCACNPASAPPASSNSATNVSTSSAIAAASSADPVPSADTTLGDADEGHYSPYTGLITITVSNNKIGNPQPHQSPAQRLEQIYARVIASSNLAVDAAPNTVELSQASYTLVGNSTCNPGKIAFISDIDGNNEVYVMDASGANPVNMTQHQATEYSPAWSPDGQKLTFASSRAGNDDIFVVDTDGSNLSNLTNIPGSDLDPAWSPNGQQIAFASWRDTNLTPGTAQIYVMNTSGTSQTRVTYDAFYYRNPTWTPDGKRLVIWGGPGRSQIYVVDADGTDMQQLTNDTFENIHSALSPDGTRIAFSSKRDDSYDIFVMNADGSNQRNLTGADGAGDDYSPAWSPDGLCIVFSSNRDGDEEIYAMNADGSNQTKLTSSPSAERTPAWQPNRQPTQVTPAPLAVLTKSSDFDGDGKDDLAFWRSSNASWNIVNSSNGATRTNTWGESGDVPVPGDYDGDGKTDLGVFKPATGIWTILNSSTNSTTIMPAGQRDDVPAPGDYDGDGKTDVAFFRTSETNWYILQSSNGVVRVQQWGTSFDRLAPGDYDGDGRTDIAVYRPNAGDWYIRKSSGGSQSQHWGGINGDVPVPADYDGDGKTDIAVFRPVDGNWYIFKSSTGAGTSQRFGDGGEAIVPADYDGDGKTDLAVWRLNSSSYSILNSSTGTVRTQPWGQSGDIPIQYLGFSKSN